MQSIRLSTDAMATRFELFLCGDDPVRLRSAAEEALDEITRLDEQLSAFRPESEISYINTHASHEDVHVEPRLFRLLVLAKEISNQTGGAFDITVGPLLQIWGLYESSGKIPSDDDLTAARAVVGISHISLDEANLTIRFDCEGVRIDLGAIGKGYAIERAADLLREAGVRHALIHCGTSTVYAIGSQPNGTPWQVAVNDLGEQNKIFDLLDSSLSVSSGYGKWFTLNGREFAHIIDPRTSIPTNTSVTAAVTGSSPTLCDALSTALAVLGESWVPILHDRWPGYDFIITPLNPPQEK